MNWLISANPNDYKLEIAFNELVEVDWRQNQNKYSVGDTVYIYSSRPIQRICFKCSVTKIGIPFSEIIDDRKYFTNPQDFEVYSKGKYFRLKLIRISKSSELSLEKLLNQGLKSAPPGPIKLHEEKETLLSYIESYF